MRKNYLILISLLVLVSLLCSFSVHLNHAINSGLPDEKTICSNPVPSLNDSVVFDDFDLIEGLEFSYFRKPFIPLISLSRGSNKGLAVKYFFDRSGKYDLILSFIDGIKGKSSIEIKINDRRIGGIIFGSSNSPKRQIIKGINIQQWSKISMEFSGDENEKCSFEKLIISPAGAFEGKEEKLEKPSTYRVFETGKELTESRKMLTDFVNSRVDSLMKARLSELAELKTPSEWKARQLKTRQHLQLFIGEYPKRTPLNAKVVGRLERGKYTIEKVIFESQPEYYITANLYIPKNRKFPVPGVLFTCGHSDEGKAQNLYHETCLGFVLKGYAVLAFDPIGQGERSEYFNKDTKKNIIPLQSSQHMYFERPSFLINWSLAGLRIWDGIRAIDYFVTRPEVDKERIGVVGNSGGGQMSFLIAAADERIKVCVAAHPGGPDENAYLKGFGLGTHSLIDREVLSLIAPRPCRIVVGMDSHEEVIHKPKYTDLKLFYEGLGFKDRIDFVLVDGVHDMKQPKREAAYEWFNEWFNKEEEGKAEPPLQPEKQKDLWCTESGFTLISLGGETGQTLNVKRLNSVYRPAKNPEELKKRIAARIGLSLPLINKKPDVRSSGLITNKDFTVEKFAYESEKGILIPALLFKPRNVKPDCPICFFVSDKGKPKGSEQSGLPFLLVRNGFIVFAVDTRGVGETGVTVPIAFNQAGFHEDLPPNPLEHYVVQYVSDEAAIQSPAFGRTMLGMRTFDVLRGLDLINSREDLKGRKIVLAGENSGGLWAVISAIFDKSVYGVVTLGTLPSFKLLVTNKYYNVWDYFWIPGVLCDFDIPDLVGLISSKPQLWIDPINELGEKYNYKDVFNILGPAKNLLIITPDKRPSGDLSRIINSSFHF